MVESLARIGLAGALAGLLIAGADAETAIPIKVVVVTMFEPGADTGDRPGEFQFWVEREKLDTVLAFPAGFRDLRLNADKGILGVVTGPGVANAATSVMALGADPRFDLRKAYWLVAGIAGVDPEDASVGSAAWASYVADGDLVREFDSRESPDGWPYARLAIGATAPNQLPDVPRSETVTYALNPALANWAYRLTRGVALGDSSELATYRARYKEFPNATRPPFVLQGDSLGGSTFWHGRVLTQWANDWMRLWTKGGANFVMTNMEDNATALALQRLSRTGRADYNRLLVLRTASNYSMPPTGVDAPTNIFAPYVAMLPGLESAYRVGSVVVRELVENWARWEQQIPPGNSQYSSKIMVYDLETKTARVVYQADGIWEAPNWSRDGSFLLVSSEGRLYRLAVDGASAPQPIGVDASLRCNNDHDLSPDGKLLAISAASPSSRQSQVYVANADGSHLRLIVPSAPSYFHGWSPDGRYLSFVANRDGKQYDIYRIPLTGGGEERLTYDASYDDGSDYSPDGTWIYFNSNRGGGWNIWRMPADGAGRNDERAQRITSDDFENWFPHPSRDGKSIVFLSFPPGTQGHNERGLRVTLRLLALHNDSTVSPTPQSLIEITGGQGTINVNSWAPDSRRFAFVSYEVTAARTAH